MPSASEASDAALASDDELQRSRVEPMQPHDAPITLVPYDPRWPRLFEREAARIRATLGSSALLVEHAGSTSVPGLTAKPIIDIVLAVPDSADEPGYVPAMQAAGYRLTIREPDWFEHRLFKGPDTNINLHVFTEGSAEIPRMLRFRDWLRGCAADRAAYAAVKRDLAARSWRHVQHYADAKNEIVQQIMDRADAAAAS